MRWLLRLAGSFGNAGALTNAARACEEHQQALACLEERLGGLGARRGGQLRRSA